jgi:hypothetical protein
MNDTNTQIPTNQTEKPENVFVSLLFNIALPAIILSKLSDLDRLGPIWALVAAFSFPLGYFIWDYIKRGKPNFIAILGFVSVLLSGGFGLFKLDGFWFAVKEAAIPLLIGVVVLGSTWTKKPLIRALLYNDKIIDVEKVRLELEARGHVEAFEKLLVKATWLLAGSFLLSAILNYGLAIYLLTSPAGTPEFNQQLGKMTAMSYPVIVLPCMVIMGLALWVLIKGIKDLTGLDLEAVFKAPPPKAAKS